MGKQKKISLSRVDFYDIMRYFAHLCPLEGTAEEIVKGTQKRFEESQAIIRWTNCDQSAARWAASDFRSLYSNFNAYKHPFLSRFHEEYISPYDLREWGENKKGVLNNALDRCFFSRW